MYRDTATVGFLADYFKSKVLGPHIITSKDNMKVFFYPTPQSSDMATLAQDLSVDLSSLKGVDKKKAVLSMKQIFQDNLAKIIAKLLMTATTITGQGVIFGDSLVVRKWMFIVFAKVIETF